MTSVFSSKFVRTIKTFNEVELNSFALWLRSPWCNSNKNLGRLFARLRKYHPAFDDSSMTKEKLFKQVLPSGKFSDRRMNNLLSDGYLAAERFIVFQNLSQNGSLRYDLLLQEMERRNLNQWFFREADKELARLEAKPVKDWEDHLEIYQLLRKVYHHHDLEQRMQPQNMIIRKMGEHISLVYLLEKAAIINEMIFRKRLFRGEIHDVSSALTKWLRLSEGVDHPAIELYRKRFAYNEYDTRGQFLELQSCFMNSFESLSEKDQKIHLLSLLNDTARMCSRGLVDITERLPLYKLGLKTRIIFHQDQLTYNTFVGIITSSNSKGDFQFTKEFITDHIDHVDEQYRDDCKTWALAHTAYWSGRFTECLAILQSRNFKMFHFQLISKIPDYPGLL